MAEVRARVDACPGALSVHQAADGGLARIRLPGGVLSARALRALTSAAMALGTGELELTSRGNVQIRGLEAGAQIELGDRIAAVGLLPSATHERARNIVASPLAGIDGHGAGGARLFELAAEVDRRLCAEPALAELPGRFLFGLDDGRGDIASLGPDVCATALSPDRYQISLGDSVVSEVPVVSEVSVVSADRVAEVLIAAAIGFLLERAATGSSAWRISELADGGAQLGLGLQRRFTAELAGPRGSSLRPAQSDSALLTPPLTPPRPGLIAQADGRSALVALAPLGRVNATQAQYLAELAEQTQQSVGAELDLRVTPWRSVVVANLAEPAPVIARAQELGLGVDEASPWYWLSTCAGRPGCAKSLADVRADALAFAQQHQVIRQNIRWSGCERRCGRPRATEVDLIATSTGYLRQESGIS